MLVLDHAESASSDTQAWLVCMVLYITSHAHMPS